MSKPVPNVLQELQGKEFPSSYDPNILESIQDKRRTLNVLLRDISKFCTWIKEEQYSARDPRTITKIAGALKIGHGYLSNIAFYHQCKASPYELDNCKSDNFELASLTHRSSQFLLESLNDKLPNLHGGKPDRLLSQEEASIYDNLTDQLRSCFSFYNKVHIHLEMTERNVVGN